MPSHFKKGLSPLARAQASLEGKQIRRSVAEHNAKKSEVAAKTKAASLPEQPAPVPQEQTVPEK